MNDLPTLTNGRGRIRCWWCRHDGQHETGPWAVTWAIDPYRYAPACYGHSGNDPFVQVMVARRGDRR